MSSSKQCAQCGVVNPPANRFCGSCGAQLTIERETAGEDGLYYCYRHKKETTRVTCGRCERPICTRCVVIGPVGPRCPDCARNRPPMRVRGALHTVGSGVRGEIRNRPIWWLWIFQIIASFFRGLFR